MKEFRLSKAQKTKLDTRRKRKAYVDQEKRDVACVECLRECKNKAMCVITTGDFMGAWNTFFREMTSNILTFSHPALWAGSALISDGKLNTVAKMQEFIEDFN